MNDNEKVGAWSGTLIGTEGWRAHLNLDLTRDASRVSGSGLFRLVADEVLEDMPVRVEGTWSKENDVLLDLTFEGTARTATINGHQEPLQQHAEAALYGTYKEEDATARKSGVVILWRYAKRS